MHLWAFLSAALNQKNRADHKPRQIMKLDYEADYESLTEMLKQLQKTPAKTFDKVNASPPRQAVIYIYKWGFSGWDKSSPSMKSTASAVRGQSCGNKMGGRLRKADEHIPPVILPADTPPSFLHLLLLFKSLGWIGLSSTTQAIIHYLQLQCSYCTILCIH